jgi:diadenosine tetraphosphate (Ap4A) HIT family hydrolase
MFIFETKNFIVESHEQPFLPRTDGGHIRILPKDRTISDRTKLDAKLAIELMRFTIVCGLALEKAMNEQGIPVIKINYQDMGNWFWKSDNAKPFLHVHIFGRATNAVKQPWPESMYLPDRKTGFYEGFEPLNEKDVESLQAEIKKIFALPKYSDEAWGL